MAATNPNLHETQAEVLKAIGHPIRLMIVKSLSVGEMTVSQISQLTAAEQSNVSRHLALLKGAGILRSRKAGLNVYYSLNSHEFHDNLRGLLDSIARLALMNGQDRRGLSAVPPSGGC